MTRRVAQTRQTKSAHVLGVFWDCFGECVRVVGVFWVRLGKVNFGCFCGDVLLRCVRVVLKECFVH